MDFFYLFNLILQSTKKKSSAKNILLPSAHRLLSLFIVFIFRLLYDEGYNAKSKVSNQEAA